MSGLEKIWQEYISSDEYGTDRTKDFEFDKKEADEISGKIGKEQFIEIESRAMDIACDAEKEGFIKGFKYATSIWKDCIN